VRIGDPMDESTLCGPLISEAAYEAMQAALDRVQGEGGTLVRGGKRVTLKGRLGGGVFVEPAIVRAKNGFATVQQETFAPILYLIPFRDADEPERKRHLIRLWNRDEGRQTFHA